MVSGLDEVPRVRLGSAATTAASAGAGAAAGAAFGPVGAGIGALAGLIKGLWADHAARVAGAKTENAAVQSALQSFDASLQAIFQAANSGQVTGAQAAGACQTLLQSFWQGCQPFTTGPGRADASKSGSNCGTVNASAPCTGMVSGHKCDKSCTVTCCVGCQDLTPTIAQAVSVLSSATGGTMTACTVYSSSYGLSTRSSYQLTYTPPAAGSAAGVASAITTSTVAGIPVWMLIASGLVGIYAMRR